MRRGERLLGFGDEMGVGVLGTTTIGAVSATPRQRALVAALALAGVHGTGIDGLADDVWAGRPPRSARSSLQNQMTRLRRTHGDDLIVCENARYRLGRPTDVAEFERVLRTARDRPTSTATVDALAGSLRLWRGVPFVDLSDSHAAEIERARLAQERARAVDLLATGRILHGDLDPCIADLRVEIEDDPYRDRVWELLFIALQRAGRPGEALAAHRDHLERLRDQFGVEPSGRLQEMGRALRLGEPLELVTDGVVSRPAAAARPEAVDAAAEGSCARRPSGRRCRVRGRRSPSVDP